MSHRIRRSSSACGLQRCKIGRQLSSAPRQPALVVVDTQREPYAIDPCAANLYTKRWTVMLFIGVRRRTLPLSAGDFACCLRTSAGRLQGQSRARIYLSQSPPPDVGRSDFVYLSSRSSFDEQFVKTRGTTPNLPSLPLYSLGFEQNV